MYRLLLLLFASSLMFTLTACDGGSEGEEGEDTERAVGCDDPGAATIPIGATATYLRTADSDNATDAVPVRLSDVGLEPGDRIRIERLGEFQTRASAHPDSVNYRAAAVFSTSSELAASSVSSRVIGALDAGEDYETVRSYRDRVATDIPEDFGIVEVPVTLTVPDGAAYIFATPNDATFEDNGDEDGDFRLCITKVGA